VEPIRINPSPQLALDIAKALKAKNIEEVFVFE